MTWKESEAVLASVGLAATFLSLVGVASRTVAFFVGATLAFAYLAGLAVRSRRDGRALEFLEHGGLHGKGYLALFRQAKRSLLLMHVDDDEPTAELIGLYEDLLERGVEIRRVVFVRERAQGIGWVFRLAEHPNLSHRFVLPGEADLMPCSFAVVDEHVVAMAVPGFATADSQHYLDRFVLRHLLVLRGRAVAQAFARMHSQVWERSLPALRDE